MFFRIILSTLFIYVPLMNAMELRNGHTIGTKRVYEGSISDSQGAVVKVIALERDRIKHEKNKCYFRCTVPIAQLAHFVCRENPYVFIDKTILQESDGKGNCPSVFVTLDKKDVEAFLKSPHLISYTRYYRAGTFNRAMNWKY